MQVGADVHLKHPPPAGGTLFTKEGSFFVGVATYRPYKYVMRPQYVEKHMECPQKIENHTGGRLPPLQGA